MALAPGFLPADASPRQSRTFAAANGHSRVVGLLKIVIPIASVLAGLAVLGWSLYNPFGRLPGLVVGPVTVSGTKIAMEKPRMTGYRKNNRAYEVTATTAYQDIRKPNVIELMEMKAKMAMDDSGTLAHLVSRTGVFDSGRDHLDLKDDISVTTDRGEQVQLKSASVELKTGSAKSNEPVRITTPTLNIDANSMEIVDNGQRITFVGGVKTILINKGKDELTAAPSPKRVNEAEAGSTQ